MFCRLLNLLRLILQNTDETVLLRRQNCDLEQCKSTLEKKVTELEAQVDLIEREKQDLTSKVNELEGRVDHKEYAAVKESLLSWQMKVN